MYYVNRLAADVDEGFDSAINDLLARVSGDAATLTGAQNVIDHVFANPATLTGAVSVDVLLGAIWGP